MNHRMLAVGFACACSCTALLSAETRQAQPASPAAAQDTAVVTVEGCLMREADVPGRRPIAANQERVKRDDDFILVDGKMIKGEPPASTADVKAEDKPVGTSGTAEPVMLKVEKISREDLHENRGKRVQIDGSFRYPERGANIVNPATDLAKIDATAMRVVGGECPAK